MRNFLFGAGALALVFTCGTVAHAIPTTAKVQWSEDGGATVVQNPGLINPAGGAWHYSGSTAHYFFDGTMFGSPLLPPGYFDTTNVNVQYSGSGTHYLTVWITQQGLTAPVDTSAFSAGFTTNTWTGGVYQVTEEAFIDPTNGLFSGTSIGSHSFTSPVDANASASALIALGNPSLYSETVKYTIYTSGSSASSNNTIDITVPEPASLGLVGAGIAALGFLRRRRDNNNA
jgi:hypothetical protein